MTDRPFAPATERNSRAILGVLQCELAPNAHALEIGSGTGQHAVCFAAALPHITWQASDVAENLAGITAWLNHAGLANILAPLELDVRTTTLDGARYDVVFSANTAHIMHFDAVEAMFSLVGKILVSDGRFILYGPFRQQGRFNTDSNAAFDASLRASDPGMGIRDLEELDRLAVEAAMHRDKLYAMPANNHIAIWAHQ